MGVGQDRSVRRGSRARVGVAERHRSSLAVRVLIAVAIAGCGVGRLARAHAAPPPPAACPQAGWNGSATLAGPDGSSDPKELLSVARSWRDVYAKVAPDAKGTPPATEAMARSRACRVGTSDGLLQDAPCTANASFYEAQIVPVDAVTFRGARTLIIPAGNRFILYGPATGGGRIGEVFDTEVRIDSHFVVIENFLDATNEDGSEGDSAESAQRDIIIADRSTLRHAELSGPSLAQFSLRAGKTRSRSAGMAARRRSPAC
jgi:hypothetical protein